MYATAIVATADRTFFCFLNTFAIISKLLEYLKNLNARNTFNVLSNLKSFSNLNPLFNTVIEGRIESKSIIFYIEAKMHFVPSLERKVSFYYEKL